MLQHKGLIFYKMLHLSQKEILMAFLKAFVLVMQNHNMFQLINLGYGVVVGKIILEQKFLKQPLTFQKLELYMVLIYLVQLHKYEDVGLINTMLIYQLHHPTQQLQQTKYHLRLLIYILLEYKLFYLIK